MCRWFLLAGGVFGVLVSGAAAGEPPSPLPSSVPALPFEARAVKEVELFRGKIRESDAEMKVSLTTGAETGHVRRTLHYRYEAGRMSARRP